VAEQSLGQSHVRAWGRDFSNETWRAPAITRTRALSRQRKIDNIVDLQMMIRTELFPVR
jgi:hypothetical protein